MGMTGWFPEKTSAYDTKFCHRDFVLNYGVMGGKKPLLGRIKTFLGGRSVAAKMRRSEIDFMFR